MTTLHVAAILATSLTLSACSILQKPIEKAAKGAGEIVTFYCNNISDEQLREQIRAKVNKYAAPNAIMVQCASPGPALVAGGNP